MENLKEKVTGWAIVIAIIVGCSALSLFLGWLARGGRWECL